MGEKEVECAFGGSAPTNLSGTVLEKEFNKFEQLTSVTNDAVVVRWGVHSDFLTFLQQ